ncbi:MAG: cupin domain-containing protein [Aquificae bacterium]|nr:cupin domain-containing protein [Aquificota bacterium]
MKVFHTNITNPEEIKEILKREGYFNIFPWCDEAGSFYDWHIHPYEEVRWIYKGEVIMGTEEGEILLKAGDRLNLPAGTKHWAKTENGVCYICGSK